MTSTESKVIIHSYNPYESRFPNRRVVTREVLVLIKILRENGYKVSIEPEDGTRLNYLAEKGLRELLTDPIIITLISLPLSIIGSLIANWISEYARGQKVEEEKIILEMDDFGHKTRFSYTGHQIDEAKYEQIQQIIHERTLRACTAYSVIPPEAERPVPIYLEHTDYIVGWGQVRLTNKGLKMENVRIHDIKTADRIRNKELKGFSIGGIIYNSTCRVCNRDFVECNHTNGALIEGLDLVEISFVQNPINPECKIEGHLES